MHTKSGNLRANQFIYKVIGAGSGTLGKVVFDDEGDVGAYNRANRSTLHFVENAGSFVLAFVLVGLAFPFPTFICTCFFAVGRIMHQVGYTSGYGGHGIGFAMSAVGSSTLEGLAFIAGLHLMGHM
jgi:hypothetical protein